MTARGVARTTIFLDDEDRDGFLRRLELVIAEEAIAILAWSLLRNHLHLLIRSGPRPFGRAIQRLLTGHALSFNRRHGRVGHLFQNRFHSVLCEEEPYLRELIRYIHLNPIRHGELISLGELGRHPFSGHSALLGNIERRWQSVGDVLQLFGGEPERARAEYLRFLALGLSDGSGLVELPTPAILPSRTRLSGSRRSGRDHFGRGELVLGGDVFLNRLRAETGPEPPRAAAHTPLTIEEVVRSVCRAIPVSPTALSLGRRSRPATRARIAIAHYWINELGYPAKDLLAVLGVSLTSVLRAAHLGRQNRRLAGRGSRTQV